MTGPQSTLDYAEPALIRRYCRLAIVALVFAVASLPSCLLMDTAWCQNLWANGNVAVALLPPVAALIMNMTAAERIHSASGKLRGRALAICGVVISVLAIVLTIGAKGVFDELMSC